ncbi:ATP-dependent RNA helicase RhlE, partial [Pantoea dispersa]|nr:ATP-dependent RNA helicase RhlE [Pantoea dispersa]
GNGQRASAGNGGARPQGEARAPRRSGNNGPAAGNAGKPARSRRPAAKSNGNA